MEQETHHHAILGHNTKFILLFVSLFITTIGLAQTQHGYVKTRGRLDSKGNLIPGQGLKGAIINIKDHTPVLVESDNGAFSFPVPSKQFRVDSVRYIGYQLVDMDACPRTYKHSFNPLYLVMETPEQLAQDQLNSEKKIRRTLQQQLQKREEELEALKEAHKITVEEYQEALRKLYSEQQGNEKLISDMAKRYAELDYDQLDEFYRQVSLCIENGELVKADSLLRSRGDIQKQVEEILQQGKAIQEGKEQLQKAEAVHEADIDEAAQRCYGFYENYKSQYKMDTAIMFLELRASLDTMNADWQLDAGFDLHYFGQIEKGERLMRKSITLFQNLAKSDPSAYYPKLAQALSLYGSRLVFTGRLKESEEILQEAIRIYGIIAKDNPKECDNWLFASIGILSMGYKMNQEYNKCEDLLTSGLNTKLSKSNIASIMTELAEVYLLTDRVEESEQLYKDALEKRRQLAESNPLEYEYGLALSLIDLANLYKNTGRFVECEGLQREAIEIYQRLVQVHPAIYEIELAQTYFDIANTYKALGLLPQSELSFEKALSTYRHLAESDHGYNTMIAFISYELGIIKAQNGHYEESIKFLETFLNSSIDFTKVPQTHFIALYTLSALYANEKNYDKAYQTNETLLQIMMGIYQNDPSSIQNEFVEILGNQSFYALFKKKFEKAEQYARQGLTIDPTKHIIQTNLATSLLFQGKYAEAEAIYRQYKDELKDSFLQDLKDFEAAGVIPEECKADVERIRKMLNE